MRIDIQPIIDNIYAAVKSHELVPGRYARYLWQDEQGTRKMGVNEYGCADAANILYTIGAFPGDEATRRAFVEAMQAMQDPDTGLFFEGTHHTYHTTAHVTAALELFDALPLYPMKGLEPFETPEGITGLLEGLEWDETPWGQSHKGAGVFAALAIIGRLRPETEDAYFEWLASHCDREHGLGVKMNTWGDSTAHQLFGWFHYLFNHAFKKRPIPCADTLIDTCISLYDDRELDDDFGRMCNFREIDWVFSLARAMRETPHRFDVGKDRLTRFAREYTDFLLQVDAARDDSFNDLHMLFGAVCALAELQQALPGLLWSKKPLRLVLDRRPFI